MAEPDLVAIVRAKLRSAANPGLAPGMQAYMKSAMPYLGVRVPQVRAVVRVTATAAPLETTDDVVAAVERLWDEAEFREERYAALAVLDVPAVRKLRQPGLITVHQRIIIEGAWWDYVDEVSHRVGELLVAFRAETEPVVRSWQQHESTWVRRSSIICQIGLKQQTDCTLLSDAVAANVKDPDFFVRKAIGWALRDYARTDPEWVRGFVDTVELSPLSRREATRALPPPG